MSLLLTEIQARWHQLFSLLEAGSDVPPSLWMRTEGLMEAATITGETIPAEIDALMDGVYQTIYGQNLATAFGGDWRDFYPFPQIPAVAKRAPVYPSTSD
ncbi:MAG: hypothetical protein HOC23_22995 [Halieaceae bacterium]|jgi:hypothetical protein|nr:hypothetical protein [Halieaceae bacterium]